MRVAFRCDGDGRIGAGHVARSVQVAAAFERAGHTVELVGRYGGLAADLVSAAGLTVRPPGRGPAGVDTDADAAIVDSYELDPAELELLAAALPAAALWDHGAPPALPFLVHYHPSALPAPIGTAKLLEGPAYAPVSPRLLTARRGRGLERALVTVGGSERGRALLAPAAAALAELEGLEVEVAGGGPDIGLVERIARADVAVTAAGATAYELACAGVPAVAVAIADNQRPVAVGLAAVGAVRGLDAVTAGGVDRLGAEVATLAAPSERERLAAGGQATVDGHGAARIRDGLAALFAGSTLPPVLRYRPAATSDADQLLAWRTEPAVRAASRDTGTIERANHVAWLEGVLADPARDLWLILHEGQPAGSVRFDRAGARAEISISVGAGERGAGLGTRAIRETTELYLSAWGDVEVVEAHVRPANAGSLRAFERAGYRPAGEGGELAVLEATRPLR